MTVQTDLLGKGSDQISADAEVQIAPAYVIWNGELLLDIPIEQAWPIVIDYPKWQNYSHVEHVSGERGGEGEVVLLKKDEGYEFPPYLARTIKLEPGRRIIWKTYPPESISNQFFGIVDFRLERDGSRTKFLSSMIYEYMVPSKDISELAAFQVEQYQNVDTLVASVFPKLTELINEARA